MTGQPAGDAVAVRTCTPEDLDRVIDLAIEIFGPFFEESLRPTVGDVIFLNQDGDWRDEYRRSLPAQHDPDQGKSIAVAEVDGTVVGFVGWTVHAEKRRGEIAIVAVASSQRGSRLGTLLCEHAFADMRSRDIVAAVIGTGGDGFHAPARALYDSLGCVPFPNVLYYKEL